MASEQVAFNITANTKEAGKAILELQRQLNKIANIKSDDAGVKAQQKEFAKINKTLGEIIEKESQRGHHYNTYAANAKKVETLNNALKENDETLARFSARKAELEQKQAAGTITPSEVNELSRATATVENLEQKRVQINADIAKYTKRNNDLNKTAKAELAGIVRQYGEIRTDESNALGLKIESNKATQDAAQAEDDLTQKVKKTSDALADSASNAEKAKDAIQDKAKQPVTQNATPLDATAKSAEEATEGVEKLASAAERAQFNVQRVATAMETDKAENNLAELIRRLETLKQAQAALKGSGLPEDYDKVYNDAARMAAQLTQQIREYKRNLLGINTENKKASTSIHTLSGACKHLTVDLKSIGNAFKTLHGLNKKLRHSFSRLSSDMKHSFKNGLRSITKYVLGFRSLFFLVRRLRRYIGEGIKNMAQFNDGNNHVNASITRLLSSLLYLKNAWATAFSPILQFVTPMLEALIDKIAAAGNAFSRFLGVLLGQKTVFQAVKVQAQDYADSLDNVGSSAGGAADKAKKLKDRLAAFDDLNVLGKDDDNDGTGGGGGGGLADAYTPNPNDMFTIVEAQSELADKIKKAWEESGFFGIGHLISQSIADWLGDIDWEDFKDDAETLGKGFGDFFNGLFGNPDFWNNLGNGAAGLVNGLIYAIKGFLDANSGTNYGQMIAEGFNNFLNDTDWKQAGLNLHDFCTGILDNIKSFFDTEDPQALASAIHDFLEGVNIGDIIWKFGQVIVSAAKVVIQVVAELVVEWGGDLGDAMWENSNLSKVTAADKGTEQYGKLMLTAQFGDWVTEQQMKTYQQILDNGLKDLWDTALVWSNVVFPNPLTHLIAFWDEAKQGWEDGWATFETVIWGDENWQGGIAEWIANLGGFGNLYDLAYGGATDLGDGFSNGMQDWWNNMATQWSAGWNAMIDWFKDIFGIHSPSTLFYDFAGDIMQGLWNGLVVAWENVKTFFSNIGTWVSNKWTEIKNKTAEIWTNIKTWLTTTVEGIRDKIATVFTVIKSKILYIWESIKEGIKSPINGILGFIESFVNKCIDGINGLIDKINGIADVEFKNPFNNQTYTLGFNIPKLNNVSIPRLAQGAVIPPNREFMAVLGDQSHGTNVEAPLDVIKQAVAEVLANNGNEEVIRLLQQLIGVVESKNLVIGDKDIGKANARYVKQQTLLRGATY